MGWTPWQLARRIYETARTPTLLMAWRLATGLTQAELAKSIRNLAADTGNPCNSSAPSCQQISRWENGRDRPGAFYQGLLAIWYRTDLARLGLVGDLRLAADDRLSGLAELEDEVNRRSFLTVVASPALFQLDQVRRRMDADLRRVLPPADTDQWTCIADEHAAAYGALPPGTLLEVLAPDLSDLAEVVGQYPQQRDLTRLAARMCGLTGALYTDLGDVRAARDWLFRADRYAVMSGDLASQHWILMAQAMVATYPPMPRRVLAIAERAVGELDPHTCAATAQLTGLAARAHATLGDRKAARSALAVAERCADSLSVALADETFFGFPRRQMLMYTTQVLTATGDPAAWDASTNALASYPESDPVDRPLILLCRARQLASTGQADHAARVAAAAITDLGPAWRVPLLASEARAVGKAISAASAQAGRQYSEVLREAMAA